VRLLALAALAVVPHVTTATPVTAVSVTGPRIAYATADCRVHLWDRAAHRVTTFGPGPACERTSTGTAVGAVAVAGTRVLFLHYTGGNTREWSLWTATPSSPTPRRLQFVAVDVDAPPPIVLGRGHDGVVPYALGRTVTVLRADGSRALRWTAPAAVTALDAGVAGVAVAAADGSVSVLSGGRVQSQAFPRQADAVALTGDAYVVQSGRTLDSRGLRPRTFTLARGTRLVGATGGRAVVVDAGGFVRTIDLVTGAGAMVGRGAAAAVDGAILATADGRRVVAGSV
jgi:hypothetical protein